MPNFGENTRDFLQFPIYYYDVTYSQSLPVRGIGGAAGVIMNGWDPVNLVPSLVHVSAAGELSISGSISASTSAVATAAAPSYVEGSTDALSMDLTGALRVTTGASGGLTDAQLRATPVPVSGTVTATTGGLTDTQLRLTPVPVSGTVSTGGLTDTQLRLTPVPVSGTVTATTGGLTDTQLRATPVPVSGTVTTGGLTDTQLRATPVPVSGTVAVTGTFYQTTQPVSLATIPDSPSESLLPALMAINNKLQLQQLLVAQAGPAGFVPIETPAFLAG